MKSRKTEFQKLYAEKLNEKVLASPPQTISSLLVFEEGDEFNVINNVSVQRDSVMQYKDYNFEDISVVTNEYLSYVGRLQKYNNLVKHRELIEQTRRTSLIEGYKKVDVDLFLNKKVVSFMDGRQNSEVANDTIIEIEHSIENIIDFNFEDVSGYIFRINYFLVNINKLRKNLDEMDAKKISKMIENVRKMLNLISFYKKVEKQRSVCLLLVKMYRIKNCINKLKTFLSQITPEFDFIAYYKDIQNCERVIDNMSDIIMVDKDFKKNLNRVKAQFIKIFSDCLTEHIVLTLKEQKMQSNLFSVCNFLEPDLMTNCVTRAFILFFYDSIKKLLSQWLVNDADSLKDFEEKPTNSTFLVSNFKFFTNHDTNLCVKLTENLEPLEFFVPSNVDLLLFLQHFCELLLNIQQRMSLLRDFLLNDNKNLSDQFFEVYLPQSLLNMFDCFLKNLADRLLSSHKSCNFLSTSMLSFVNYFAAFLAQIDEGSREKMKNLFFNYFFLTYFKDLYVVKCKDKLFSVLTTENWSEMVIDESLPKFVVNGLLFLTELKNSELTRELIDKFVTDPQSKMSNTPHLVFNQKQFKITSSLFVLINYALTVLKFLFLLQINNLLVNENLVSELFRMIMGLVNFYSVNTNHLVLDGKCLDYGYITNLTLTNFVLCHQNFVFLSQFTATVFLVFTKLFDQSDQLKSMANVEFTVAQKHFIEAQETYKDRIIKIICRSFENDLRNKKKARFNLVKSSAPEASSEIPHYFDRNYIKSSSVHPLTDYFVQQLNKLCVILDSYWSETEKNRFFEDLFSQIFFFLNMMLQSCMSTIRADYPEKNDTAKLVKSYLAVQFEHINKNINESISQRFDVKNFIFN